ncbi:MAG: peptidoglycan D,D-transpeptidase FtsI family protein [Acidimicrobiia bacterium]
MVALLSMISLGGITIGARLTQIQGAAGSDYARMAANQRVRRIPLPAERGSIFDRHGRDLALSVSQQSVWANPRVVADAAGLAQKLAPILGMDESVLRTRLVKPGAAFVYLARKVDPEVARQVAELEAKGIGFIPESKRHYPSGPLAAGLLGAVGIDNQGLSGLEALHEEILVGHPGELVVERDPAGRTIPQGQTSLRPSRRGDDLILTIDQALQFELERELERAVLEANARGGMAVLADVRTGDVLAMANVGAPAAGPGPRAVQRNRAVVDVYEPGSTNKVITVAGALEEGMVTASTQYKVPDQLAVGNHVFSDHDPHPPTDWSVTDILVNSSNVGTIMIGKQLGKERIDRYLRAFGFGRRTGVGFPGEPPGILLDVDDWYTTSMGTVPIGNGLAVTALQMLNVYTTIANDGVWHQPRLVAATVGTDGARSDRPAGDRRRVVSAGTARTVNEMLQEVVRTGTGTNAAIPGYTVAGKTGTARKPREGARGYSDQYMASFVGFVPAEQPRLAAVVVLDEPRPIYGGLVAAPVFSRVLRYALRLERVPPPPASHPTVAGSGPTSGRPTELDVPTPDGAGPPPEAPQAPTGNYPSRSPRD